MDILDDVDNFTLYPVTIIPARLTGLYEPGKFLAFKRYHYALPKELDQGDNWEYRRFWENFKGIVGSGDTPNDALIDLKEKVKRLSLDDQNNWELF